MILIPNSLYKVKNIWFYVGISVSDNQDRNFRLYFQQITTISAAINIANLCCHRLEYLQHDKVFVKLSGSDTSECRKEAKWSRLK